jgi:hypothetical protein
MVVLKLLFDHAGGSAWDALRISPHRAYHD